MSQQNPISSIAKAEVTFVNGNTISFDDAAGLPLSSLRTVASVLKEEIRAVTPEKEPAKASA